VELERFNLFKLLAPPVWMVWVLLSMMAAAAKDPEAKETAPAGTEACRLSPLTAPVRRSTVTKIWPEAVRA